MKFILAFVWFSYFSFLCFSFLSVFTPDQQSTALATTVKRRSLLPGVTTLSRDLERRPILGASNHYYLVFLLCGIFHCWSEETQENILKALYLLSKFKSII